MKHLQAGEFHGQTNQIIHSDGVTLTDIEYTHDKVDWHYHENAYFTFILQGNVIEGNKKEVYNCSPGTLLFHNWQEPHYNIKPDGFTRGFHIELDHTWLRKIDFNLDRLTGSINIENPSLKITLYKIFKETKIADIVTTLSVHSLLLHLLEQMTYANKIALQKTPLWVNKIKEILHEKSSDRFSLAQLAALLDVHPVHISRDFPKYFKCSLGEYIRKLKIEKSLCLIVNKKYDLTEIAFECGFSDQSHFTRCFKQINGLTPSLYRKLILS